MSIFINIRDVAMSDQVFQIISVSRPINHEVELADALGFPEVSSLDDTQRKWQLALQTKIKTLLEDPELSPPLYLHRRRITAPVGTGEVQLVLEPLGRSPEWEQPVTLRFGFVRWCEDGELHQAYIPALHILVFAPRENLLIDRVEEHIRLVLLGRRNKIGLSDLVRISNGSELRIGTLEVTAKIKTPKQIATAGESEKTEASVLEKVAEELEPIVQTSKATLITPNLGEPRFAFEMEDALQNLADTLSGPQRRSILLVGPAGCGKTALIREFAWRRREFGFGETPCWSTSGARLITGEIGYGVWQERCQEVCREVLKTRALLHLGNLAELLQVGKASRGQQSVGNFLRPWIARGDILAIAECTPEQVGVIEREDPHLLGSFLQLNVTQPSPEKTRRILEKVWASAPGEPVEAPSKAGVQTALDRLHRLHLRYANYSANPGRPLRFLKNLLADRFPSKRFSEDGVTTAFSRETGLPLVLLDDRVSLDLPATHIWFAQRVIGQDGAIDHVLNLLALIKARLARPRKPLASFLFIGPTGTGKTELAKALAEFLFGDAGRMARFDLNQFSDAVSVQRLIGGPATGNAEGLLTARVREQPFSVLLLDEFEKADPTFFDLLLQMLGDGRLTDAAGRVADFCNSVIVMTSNLGAEGFQRGPSGFRATQVGDAQEHFAGAVQNFLRPEIYNRIDAIVPFQALSAEIVLAITHRQLDLIRRRDGLRLRDVDLSIAPDVAEYLARRGFDARYGARPLKRAIERELLTPLAEAINAYTENLPLKAEVHRVSTGIQVHVRVQKSEAEETQRQSSRILAEQVQVLRRKISRLQQSPSVSALENQADMIESLQRRLARAKWQSPEQQAKVASLAVLKRCLGEVSQLGDKTRELENDVVSSFYQHVVLEENLVRAKIAELEASRSQLLREIFRLKFDKPDDVVLALFSEDRGTLLRFVTALYNLGKENGKVIDMDYFLPPVSGRTASSKPVRMAVENMDKFMMSPPEKLIGLAMHIRGDLFFPRFQEEAGTHVVKEKKKELVCLIQTASAPLSQYQPPAGIDRQGSIQLKGASLGRVFDVEEKCVLVSEREQRPWHGESIEVVLSELTEARLRAAIETVGGG